MDRSAGTANGPAALAGVLGQRLDRADLPAAERAELERQLGRLRAGGTDPAAPGRSITATLPLHGAPGAAACRPWPGRA